MITAVHEGMADDDDDDQDDDDVNVDDYSG